MRVLRPSWKNIKTHQLLLHSSLLRTSTSTEPPTILKIADDSRRLRRVAPFLFPTKDQSQVEPSDVCHPISRSTGAATFTRLLPSHPLRPLTMRQRRRGLSDPTRRRRGEDLLEDRISSPITIIHELHPSSSLTEIAAATT